MTEPKIRYDIQATAKGGAEVASLTSELSKLDDALDPQTAARARELSAELQRLGQEQSAIAGFLELKRTSVAARDGLDQAQAAAQSFAKELAASEKPTRAQAGHLEKLRDAVQGGKAALQDQTQALDVARSKLTELGLASDGLSAKQGQVGKALESAKLEARTLAAEYSALQKAQQAAAASADLLAAAETEAAAAAERLGAADGAAAMRQLEQAARQAEVELAQLTDTLRSAEATAQEFARASDLAASSSQDDVAATQRRVQAAQALISAENQLTTEQRELAAQRNAGRAGLVAEAQALLASARAADESRLATQRLVAQTRSAGDAIKAAFAQTGVRSIQAIEAELSSVGSSVSLLERKFRAGAITADDLARAVAGAAVRMNARNAEIAQVPALPGQFARLGE